MQLDHFFHLSGYGSLHALFKNSGQIFVRIKPIQKCDPFNSRLDDVWVDCTVSDSKHLARLNQLIDSVHAGANVVVTYRAEYSRFLDVHYCRESQGASQILSLQGKLQELDDCYVDDQLVDNLICP